jgi:hypothetical protein
MRLKKLGSALVVIAALGAVLASSALAGAVTEDVKWYTGASPGTELSGSEAVSASLVGSATLLSGSSVGFHMTGVECLGCKIENSGGTAVGSGQLRFTGVTVEKPARCSVGSTITTKALSWQADWMFGSATYWRFVPTAGAGTAFIAFELSGTECSMPGIFNHIGTLFVQSANSTGTQAAEQKLNSSGEINSGAGGVTHFGSEEAALAATLNFKLSGAKAGTAFGIH